MTAVSQRPASLITFEPGGSIAATNVRDAILEAASEAAGNAQEVQDALDALTALVATDSELAAAVATLTASIAAKQDAATAATDAELASAVSTLNAAMATDSELASAVASLTTSIGLKQDALTAATDAELAAAVAAINAVGATDAEVAAAVAAHTGASSGAHAASAVSVAGLTSLTGGTVQAVLANVDTRLPAAESNSATAAQKAANLNDLASAATARTNLGLGTAAQQALDTDATMAADSDTRVPSQKAARAYVLANAGATPAATTAVLGKVKLGSPPRDPANPVIAIPRTTADRWVPRRRIRSNFTGDATKAITGVAATGVFSAAAHGYVDGDLLVFALTTGGSGLTAGLPYYVAGSTERTTAIAGTNNDLIFTSRIQGGSDITIRYVVAGTLTPLTITVAGKAITVNVATDAGGAATSTAAQVTTAVNADAVASLLVSAANAAANDGTGVVAAMTAIALSTAGGTFTVAARPGGPAVVFTSDLTAGTAARKRDGYLFNFENMIYTTSASRPALRAADGGTATPASLFTKQADFRDWEIRLRYRPANGTTTGTTDYGPGLYGGYEDLNNCWQATQYHASGNPVITMGATVAGTLSSTNPPTDVSPRATTVDRIVRLRKVGDWIAVKDWRVDQAEPDWQRELRIRPPIGGVSPNTTTDNPERGACGIRDVFCGAYFLEFAATELVRENVNMLHNGDLARIDCGHTADVPKVVTGVGATGIFTVASHGYSADDLVVFAGMASRVNDYGIVPYRSYFVVAANLATNTFSVSTTRGGAVLTFTPDLAVGYVIRNPVPALWTRPTAALLSGNRLEIEHVAGPDGSVRPALSMVCVTPNDPNLSWFQCVWNPLASGAGGTNQRMDPHPQSLPARRLEFSCWTKGANTAIQTNGLGATFDIYMYDAYVLSNKMERQTYHPGLQPSTAVDAADPASYDGAQTVGSWGWTWIRSEIEIPQFEALHQMRAQILYHEATDTGNVYVMDPCLRPIG